MAVDGKNTKDDQFGSKFGTFDCTPVSISQRWPNLKGRTLQDLAITTYVEDLNATLPFFAGKKRLLHRHPVNRDDQADTVEKYKKRVFTDGYIRGSRSASMKT